MHVGGGLLIRLEAIFIIVARGARCHDELVTNTIVSYRYFLTGKLRM